MTRAHTVTVAGRRDDAPVMTIGDKLIDSLQREIKHPVDGLLGGSYLREFLVTIDYPQGELRLQRYLPSVVDEFKRVGVSRPRERCSPVRGRGHLPTAPTPPAKHSRSATRSSRSTGRTWTTWTRSRRTTRWTASSE